MRTCNEVGCHKKHLALGLCKKHYQRYKKYGDATISRQNTSGMKLIDRLSVYTRKTRLCWEWTGSKKGYGYGAIRVNGKMVGAHRVSYELFNGAIPCGQHVLHSCDNPGCVNPEHLFTGTHTDNMRDMTKKGRHRINVEAKRIVSIKEAVS